MTTEQYQTEFFYLLKTYPKAFLTMFCKGKNSGFSEYVNSRKIGNYSYQAIEQNLMNA